MHPPRATPYTIKSRRSNSTRLHRTLLDIYNKRRFIPSSIRFSLTVAAVLFLAFMFIASRPVRSKAVTSLRGAAGALSGVAGWVAGAENSEVLGHEAESHDQGENETNIDSSEKIPASDNTHVQNGGHSKKDEEDEQGNQHGESPREENVMATLDYVTRRNVPSNHVTLKSALGTPPECTLWRQVARNESEVYPYRLHFTSLDVTDWFMYVSIFDEMFHRLASRQHKRPRYIDIAANHARRWSATWFFDRCMGWDGICVEANPKYFDELKAERHCHVVETCVSDTERVVKFSMTSAYGGVVTGEGEKYGVDGKRHEHDEKFAKDFQGIKELTCTTVKNVTHSLGMERFDFMSLDVEGHELPVLQGIDWNRTRIDVIVTENKSRPVQELLENLGYVLHKGVIKDFIYVHSESGHVLNQDALEMARRLDRATYKFRKA